MNALVLLPLQEGIAQRSAGKHDQWRLYITVLVINDGITKSISILPAVIHSMTKFVVDQPWDWFHQGVQWTLDIREQNSTLSLVDLDLVHHLPHALLQDRASSCLPEGNQ